MAAVAMNVLLLEDSNYSGTLSAVQDLGRLGHRVVVAAPFRTPAMSSRWCREHLISPPPLDTERYRDFVLSLLDRQAFDVAFMLDDPITDAVSGIRSQLPPAPDFLLPPEESSAIARSKLKAQQFAESIGVPTPRTLAPAGRDEFVTAAEQLGFPVIMKGSHGCGGMHVYYLTSPEQVLDAYDALAGRIDVGEPMLQEFIPGDTYLAQVVYDRGRPLAVSSHLKVRQFPMGGGVTACAMSVREPALDENALRIFSALDWHGPGKADFKRDDRDGSFKLMELDPRLPASTAVAARAGADLISVCCRLARGERAEGGLITCRSHVRFRYVGREVLCLASRPTLLPRLLADSLDPRVGSDFDWGDLRGTTGLFQRSAWHFDQMRRNRRLSGGRDLTRGGRSGPRVLSRLAAALISAGFTAVGLAYRIAKALRSRAGHALARAALKPGGW